jgi:23S rRNA (adenine2503-C2)-methyltransferase
MFSSSIISMKKSIIGMTGAEIKHYCLEHGYRTFHGTQVFTWVYDRFAENFDEMTDLPLSLRNLLNEEFLLDYFKPIKTVYSGDGTAVKYSFPLDKTCIETVVLTDRNGRTSFCISSQTGCPAGCIFCATGRIGLIRNLTKDEIINEIYSLIKLHKRPDSILFMGMGEPLLNYSNVKNTIKMLHDASIGFRKITVSTCGIVKKIHDLAMSGLRPRLAVSLGSAIDEKRKKLIPLSKYNDLKALKKAIIFYREKTKRRVSIEYTIIKDVNDTTKDAHALADFAKQTGAHVNVIRFNPVDGIDLSAPRAGKVNQFKTLLKDRGIEVSERYRRGADIQAACGQLVPSAFDFSKSKNALT